MSIKIPVSADFDPSSISKQLQQFRDQLNSMGQQIADANKIKFEPVTSSTVDDMRRVVQQFEALKRVSGDFNRRINATGQKDAGFMELDWARLYPDAASRSRQMAKSFQYVTGLGFTSGADGGQSPGQRPAPPTTPGGSAGKMAVDVAGAGLRATGPVGGVAAGALNTGMSSGFGAGLMGLMGGILALGVGKAVSSAMSHIGTAEDNAVSYDRLKRTLGDVDVAFEALKVTAEANAERFNMTFAESAKLTTQFAKLGNVVADQSETVANEAGIGVGLSRSLGLDNSVGVGVLGQMRGMRITNNEQDTRRMALLIGETIGRSNAFAKSDEVMAALAGFAVNQTRQSMAAANVSGYAGQFSAMVGTGIPGMDPTGAANLIGRINAALSSGGAAGEASQFFTSMIGQGMGLDVFQTQVLREGGAFSTLDEAFGEGSVASRYGMSGPGSGDNRTFLEATLDQLRQKYGHDRNLLAKATSEHLGIGLRQSMALLQISPNEMGAVAGYAGDLTQLNAKSISSLTQVVTGSDADRQAVAADLRARRGRDQLSADERASLDAAMAGDSVEDQKRILAELVKGRDQEQTQGKDIHESKIAIENLKTSVADKLIPLTQNIRDGILFIAGRNQKSAEDVLLEIAELESKSRERQIVSESKSFEDQAQSRFTAGFVETMLSARSPLLESQSWWQEGHERLARDDMSQDERRNFETDFAERINRSGLTRGNREVRQQIVDLADEHRQAVSVIRENRKKAIADERDRLSEQKITISEQATAQREAEDAVTRRRLQIQQEAEENRNAQERDSQQGASSGTNVPFWQLGEGATRSGTRLPDGGQQIAAERSRFIFDVNPIEITLRNERREQVGDSQFATGIFRPASPFGERR